MDIEFSSDCPELVELMADIGGKYMNAVTSRTLNKTVNFVKREAAAEVSARTGVSAAKIRRRIKQIKALKARPGKLVTVGFVGEATIPVGDITPKPRAAGLRGVSYKVIPGSKAEPDAFFAKMASGRRSAYVRKTAASLPIREVQANIGPVLRRSVRRIMRDPAKTEFTGLFLLGMDSAVEKGLKKRGLVRR